MKKNEILVELSDALNEKLNGICEMTGQDKGSVAATLLQDFAHQYCDGDGNFTPRKAKLMESEYELQYRRNCGEVNVERRVVGECFILDEVNMMGAPYYKIFHDGKLMKIPQNCIEFKV